MRGGAAQIARLAHNQKVGGANPPPATSYEQALRTYSTTRWSIVRSPICIGRRLLHVLVSMGLRVNNNWKVVRLSHGRSSLAWGYVGFESLEGRG